MSQQGASGDREVQVGDVKSLRYVKKDTDGRVKKALFEPDQNQRVKQQIDDILGEISAAKRED